MSGKSKKEEHVANQNAIRFTLSLLMAIISVALLSMIGCTRSDEIDKNSTSNSCYSSPSDFLIKGCTALNQPVCGCNGVTYTNACEAIYQHGILSYINGPCEISTGCIQDSIDTFVEVDTTYLPVCGCNGVSYPNASEANYAGVSSYTEGLCGTIEVLLCGDKLQVIGIQRSPNKTYRWIGDIEIGCATCPITPITISDTTELILEVFENEKTGTPIELYPFKLIATDCSQ